MSFIKLPWIFLVSSSWLEKGNWALLSVYILVLFTVLEDYNIKLSKILYHWLFSMASFLFCEIYLLTHQIFDRTECDFSIRGRRGWPVDYPRAQWDWGMTNLHACAGAAAQLRHSFLDQILTFWSAPPDEASRLKQLHRSFNCPWISIWIPDFTGAFSSAW